MQVDQMDDVDHRGSQGSDPGDSGSTSQPLTGSRLRDKLQKLAKWRIDSSSIEFPEDGPEFLGGFATVSRAFLVSTSSSQSSADNSAHTGDENKSDGGTLPQRKVIAVKKLKIEDGKDKERVLELALREAGFLTELSHGNVITLRGFVEEPSEDRVWLVFPWAAYGNLKDFVALEEWEIPERVCLINDVTKGVEYLHSRDPPIYHGDLKSANVLVFLNCRAVITDFGSARRVVKRNPTAQPYQSENQGQPAMLLETKFCEATSTVTLTGNQYTLRWAAPELLMGDEPDLWSDIWALGWIIYEVMTNVIPFQNVQDDSMVVEHVIHGDLPCVADHVRMALIRELYSLMITCWSINPSKRSTAEDCRKSMSWMPMAIPDRQQAENTTGPRAHSARLLNGLGWLHKVQNDYTNASKLFTEALSICTETADDAGKALALCGLAEVNLGQNNSNEAVKLYSEAVQIYTDIGNTRRRAEASLGLAALYLLRGEYGKAATFYSEVVQICTEIGSSGRRVRADGLCGLADVRRIQYDYSRAVPLYSEALQISTDIGGRRGRARALWGLAEVHRLQKQYSQAAQLHSEALQIRTDVGSRDGRAWSLMSLGDLHRDQDQHEAAIPLYEQSAGIFEEIGNTRYAEDAMYRATRSREQLEDVHPDQDQHEAAIPLYEQAAGIVEEIQNTRNAEKARYRTVRSRELFKLAEAE